MDFVVPGTDESRSFSMANTPNRDGLFEFVIKIYPGGLFSEFLAEKVQPGDRLQVEAPFGTFTLRESRTSDLVFVAAARGWPRCWACCGRWPSAGSTARSPSTTAPARQQDLCFIGELAELAERLSDFTYVPALSHAPDDDGWAGRGEWSPRSSSAGDALAGVDAYVCGPPPMVDAAIATLTALGVKENNIHYDKFTTTGEPEA
jgi:propane monooxygenase reductase subunit